jgi:ABC-type multidrug transport system permease subunit
LLTAFAFAFAWPFITIGLAAKTPQAANGYSLIVFPFTFVSSSYVPVSSMPGWLQAFARNQPVTAMVDAVRSLSINATGGVDTHSIVVSLLWTVATVAIAGPIATWRFARG